MFLRDQQELMSEPNFPSQRHFQPTGHHTKQVPLLPATEDLRCSLWNLQKNKLINESTLHSLL